MNRRYERRYKRGEIDDKIARMQLNVIQKELLERYQRALDLTRSFERQIGNNIDRLQNFEPVDVGDDLEATYNAVNRFNTAVSALAGSGEEMGEHLMTATNLVDSWHERLRELLIKGR